MGRPQHAFASAGPSRDWNNSVKEVSGRVVCFLLDAVRERKLPQEPVVADLPVTLAELRDTKSSVSWPLFAEILERVETLVGGPAELERIGYRHHESPHFGFFKKLAHLFVSARDLYWMGAVWYGQTLFSSIDAQFEDLPNGRVRTTLQIPPDHRDLPQFFRLMLGPIRSGPHLLGQEDALVEMELSPRRAVYTITPPPSLTLWVRLRRAGRMAFAARSAIEELSAQQAELKQRYRQLREANTQVSAQAAQLERINRLGRELAEHLELDELTGAILELLRGCFECGGLSLWLMEPGADERRLLRELGSKSSGALRSHSLVTAGRRVGRLDVWDLQFPKDTGRPDILDELIPWISVALDNALSFRVIRTQAQTLEKRVQERTADLASVNKKLREQIRQRERAARALKLSQKQLLASERLASTGTLAAGIAHEINNPIASILACAQYGFSCKNDPEGLEVMRRQFEKIVLDSRRCGRIVKSVLQFACDEPTEKWTEDLNEVVRRAVALTRNYAAEHSARIGLELTKEPLPMVMNPIQMEQVVVNLVRNAIEAGSKEPHATVRTRVVRNQLCLSVSDDGCGIRSEDLARVFDPFFSKRKGHGGTGLGLSVVHGIIREHQGQIKVETREGAGTTITIELPPGKIEERCGRDLWLGC